MRWLYINKLKNYSKSVFENIKHKDYYGNEYWLARELSKALEYKDWRNFQRIIDKAVTSANNSVSGEEDWVVEVNKPIKTGKGKEELIKDYKLSRYMCYLIVQNLEQIKRKESWLYINKLKNYNKSVFENIKHIDENGNEFWFARELMSLLEYSKWERFSNAIDNAKKSCENSGYNVEDHFPKVGKMINLAKGAKRRVLDYKLSRYACYLIVQNGDSRKQVVALGQTYFAVQTRKQELTEKEYSSLTEDEKRFYRRNITRKGNYSLNIAAKNVGVKNFDKFHNAGYRGLYNGESANDIARRKKLRYRQDILDNMWSAELGANIFRISQTEDLLKKQSEPSEQVATTTHYNVGRIVRKAIKEMGGTMPEDYPTPEKSLKQLEKERKRLLIENKKKDD